MRLVSLLALVIVALFAASSAACSVPRHGVVVKRTKHAWVAWRHERAGDGDFDARVWSACMKGHRAVTLGHTVFDPADGESLLLYPRLAGRYVGFVTAFIDHYGSGGYLIHRIDLARRRSLYDVLGGDRGFMGESGGVLNLQMTAHGEIAWLGNDAGAGTRVFVMDTAGQRVVDADAYGPNIRALGVHGRAISWRHSGEVRTTQFAPLPTWCPLGPDSRVLARSDKAWVAIAPRRRLLGCAARRPPFLIARADSMEASTTGARARSAVIRGSLAGVWIDDRINTSGATHQTFVRVDLATSSFLPTVEAFRRGNAGYDVGVLAFDMNASGYLAWLANEDTNHNHVVLFDEFGRRLVDDAPQASRLDNLLVDGNAVSWTVDGNRRSATFSDSPPPR
jgi:hypothetical protein